MFDPTSRYYSLAPYTVTDARGRTVQVVPVPPPPMQNLLGYHLLKKGQRIDHLAYRYIKDPDASWRISEMNNVMQQEILTEQSEIAIPQNQFLMGLGIAIKVNGSPDNDLVQANKVEVYERMGETTYYSISYPEDIINGDMPKLIDSRLDPGSVLSIIAGVDDNSLQCLVKGPVYSQQIHLEHGGEGSTVEVRGADTAITMDREIKSVVWTDVTDGDTVTSIAGNYGFTPDVATTDTTHLEDKHSLVQRETDLNFVRRLARKNGCYFWITSDNNDIETAHFQRPQLDGDPAGDLIINFDSPTIQQLDIHWDVERPTSVEGSQIDLDSLDNLDGDVSQTPQTILGAQKLLDITGDTRTMHVSSPADDAAEMQAKSEGALIEADWFIRASCTTNINVLGFMVRANTVVNLKGAGSRHSGKYLVSAVRHIIDAADHKMEIELVRNGWGSVQTGGVAGKIF